MRGPTLAAIDAKLKEIYDDLADNVTHIYGRQDLHLIIDLAYHSPLRFYYDGKLLRKAYPEVLIVGDTRTGKTQCAEALQAHYGLGVIAGGEAMSYAGLVGGLQQIGKSWNCTWGKIPQNNRRLVIIDEATGMTDKDIAQMSAVRSQGIASITKIQSQQTEARTRLIWLANPRGDITVNQFSSGVDIIESLISFPEDIARWDCALIVSKDEVDFDHMSLRRRSPVPHVFTSEVCKSIVLWAWTREAREIEIIDEAEEICYELGKEMCKKYSSDFTLVNPSEQRIKLIRLATALAARLFSTQDGNRLIVFPNHVTYIYKFLNRIYDSKYFKYDSWSTNQNAGTQLINREAIKEFCLSITPAGCLKFLDLKTIRLQDIEHYLGVPYDEAKHKLSVLLLNNAVARTRGEYYKKVPEFNMMLAEYGKQNGKPVEKEF
jgi:hypothetical protein